MNNSKYNVEQGNNIIMDVNDFMNKKNIKQTPYIDSNRVQMIKKDIKVETKSNNCENDKQLSLNAIGNASENKLTLKEFDTIFNDYRKKNPTDNNENISYDLNIYELIKDLDELDLIMNDKAKHIENGNNKECIKLEKINKILKLNNNKDNSVIDNKLLTPQEKVKTTDGFTLKDNDCVLNSLYGDLDEVLYDFEENIKINEIFISNNNIAQRSLNTDDINSIQNIPHTSIKIIDDDNFDKSDIIFISSDEDTRSIIEVDDNQNNDSDSDDYHSSDFEFIDEDEAKKTGYIINNINKVVVEIDKTSQDLIIHDYFKSPVSNKDNHEIPNGVDYINLFGGNYTPLPTLSVQNKAIDEGTSMNVAVNGIGFDMRMLQENPELEAFRDEAHECEQKILKLYPIENRRKRFRRH